MTAYNIIKSLSRRGNTVLGTGCYAAAIEYRSDTTKIIKIGNSTDDPWLDYYSLVVKPNQHNPCVPRVFSLYIDATHNFYVCTMERLVQPNDASEYKKAAKDIVCNYIAGVINKEEFIDQAVDYPKAIPSIGAMLYVMDQIVKNTDDDEGTKKLDLHSGNIMSRPSGALVITDPWCQPEDIMEDIAAVEDWAERTLGFYEV